MAVWSETNVAEISEHKRIDSEFFNPKYVLSEQKVRNVENVIELGSLGKFLIGPFGSAFHVTNYESNSDYRYIRGKDVKPFRLQDNDNVYMPEKDFKRLIKYAVLPDDLLITVVGTKDTVGYVSIVPKNEKGIFSCKSTVFRNVSIDAYYLLAYLNSSYGKDCLFRRQRGAIQVGLNKDDLKTIPIPLFSAVHHEEIGNKVKEALKLEKQSKVLYGQAEDLLDKELGLNKLVFVNPKSYEAQFSEVMGNGRIDADHYQMKYKQIKELIEKYPHGYQPLLQLTEALSPNINPKEYPATTFNYVELSNINSSLGLVDGSKLVKGSETPSRAKRQVAKGDILASSVVGSVDKAGIIDSSFDGALASTGFFHFRTKGVEPEYLLILIRSLLIKMQLHQEATGGILSSVSESNLQNVIIPSVPIDLQLRIVQLVKASHSAKRKSEKLLEEAKKDVEDLIEGAVY